MDKKDLRTHIRLLKKQHSKESLQEQSKLIINKLENNNDFINAKIVMLYSSLPDEVHTHDLIERWRNKKRIILPTVVGNDIIPVELCKGTEFAIGDFNILEPQSDAYQGSYDLIIVPGVAFDKEGNRIGRGKGYYDRFLSKHIDIKRIGICFDFQMIDNVPTEDNDIKMDEVISL